MRHASHVDCACRSAKAQRSAAARLADDADDDAENIGPSQPASQRPSQKQVRPLPAGTHESCCRARCSAHQCCSADPGMQPFKASSMHVLRIDCRKLSLTHADCSWCPFRILPPKPSCTFYNAEARRPKQPARQPAGQPRVGCHQQCGGGAAAACEARLHPGVAP